MGKYLLNGKAYLVGDIITAFQINQMLPWETPFLCGNQHKGDRLLKIQYNNVKPRNGYSFLTQHCPTCTYNVNYIPDSIFELFDLLESGKYIPQFELIDEELMLYKEAILLFETYMKVRSENA